jgi:hypothetical protein
VKTHPKIKPLHQGQRKMFLVLNLLIVAMAFSVIDWYRPSEAGAEFSIRPSITLREEYDDNIFLTKDNRVGDYITRILPSVTLNYRAPMWDVTMNGTVDWYYYARRDESNATYDLNLTSNMKVINNLLYFDVSDIYSSVVLNPQLPSTETNFLRNRSDTNNLIISPYFKYQLNPATELFLGYGYSNIWYRSGDGIKRQMHTGFAAVQYSFSPRLNTSLGILYIADRPEQTEPNDNQTAAFVKAVYAINPQTTLDGAFGYTHIAFSGGQDNNKPIYNIGVIYRLAATGQSVPAPSPIQSPLAQTPLSFLNRLISPLPSLPPAAAGQIELRASGIMAYQPQFGVDYSTIQQISVRYGETVIIGGRIYHSRDEYLLSNRVDEVLFGVAADIEYRPAPKWTLRVSGNYAKDKFQPQNEKRDDYGASGGVSYRLTSKITALLDYFYRRQSSHVAIDTFRDNLIALSLAINF